MQNPKNKKPDDAGRRTPGLDQSNIKHKNPTDILDGAQQTPLLLCFPLIWGQPPNPLDPAIHGVDVIRKAKRTRNVDDIITTHIDLSRVLEHIERIKAYGYQIEIVAWPDFPCCLFVFNEDRTIQDAELKIAYRFAREMLDIFCVSHDLSDMRVLQ